MSEGLGWKCHSAAMTYVRDAPWQNSMAAGLPDLTGSTAVVTGANAGLGRQCARQLAAAGARVVLACRNLDKAAAAVTAIRAQLPRAELAVVRLDVADLSSVQRAAAELARYDIDMLVCNAGVTETRGRQVTVDGFELMMGGNHLGHFALVARLLEDLRPGARVVTVGSIAHRWSRLDLSDLQAVQRFSSFRQYGRSKTAVMTFALELDRRCRAAGRALVAGAAHPGLCLDAVTGDRQLALGRALAPVCQGKDDGAWPLTYAALAGEGGTYVGPAGWQELTGPPTLCRPRPHLSDPRTAATLWTASERLVGLTLDV